MGLWEKPHGLVIYLGHVLKTKDKLDKNLIKIKNLKIKINDSKNYL